MNEMRRPLSAAEIEAALPDLPGWELRGGRLHREYKFRDFIEAWGFMAGAALVIQAMDHHPEWSNVYSLVTVDLSTHDAHGVTRTDLDLAARLEELASR